MNKPLELRCPGRKVAEIIEPDVIEWYCNSRVCGATAGTAVLHRADVKTGEIISTRKYKVPPRQKGKSNGSANLAAVRPA